MAESPKSERARTAFKPISKMASRSILRDRNPPNPPGEQDSSTRPLHMVTPSKNAFQTFFGKVDRATSSTPPPPVPSIPVQHRMSTTSSNGGERGGNNVPVTPFRASRAYTEHGTIIQPSNEATPAAPKIRAGMTPEARTRLMPTPKPLPPSKLRGNQTPAASSGSTMRLVQPRQSISRSQEPFTRDTYELPMPMALHAGSLGEGLYAGGDEWDAPGGQAVGQTESGWQEIGSQSSNETVLVTVRYVPACRKSSRQSNVLASS